LPFPFSGRIPELYTSEFTGVHAFNCRFGLRTDRAKDMSEFFHLWWDDWASFLHMGRHGVFVWGSVAATVIALAGEEVALRRRVRRAQMAAQEAAS
jgi:heme exporter protein CcmD